MTEPSEDVLNSAELISSGSTDANALDSNENS